MSEEFGSWIRRVHRRRAFRLALARGVTALAAWTAAIVALLGVGRMLLALPIGAAVAALAVLGAAHALRRAAAAHTDEFETGIWVDGRLGLPATAATAVAMQNDPRPDGFRDALLRRAGEEVAPHRESLLAWGPPPAALDLLVGGAVIALALGFLPTGGDDASRGAAAEASAAPAAGASSPDLDASEIAQARLDAIREDRARGASAALVVARVARLEEDLASAATRSGEKKADLDTDARIEALARNLPPGAGAEKGGRGAGSTGGEGPAGGREESASALRELSPADKQRAILTRPDWPRDMDWLVAKYFHR